RRTSRSPADGRTLVAISSSFPETQRTGARGTPRTASISLFKPLEPWKDPAGRRHIVELRSARFVDDSFFGWTGARNGRNDWELLPPPKDRRRDYYAPVLPRRRACARVRLMAPSLQRTEACGNRQRCHGGV